MAINIPSTLPRDLISKTLFIASRSIIELSLYGTGELARTRFVLIFWLEMEREIEGLGSKSKDALLVYCCSFFRP